MRGPRGLRQGGTERGGRVNQQYASTLHLYYIWFVILFVISIYYPIIVYVELGPHLLTII